MKFLNLVVKISIKRKINKVLFFFCQKSGFLTIQVVSFGTNSKIHEFTEIGDGHIRNINWKF